MDYTVLTRLLPKLGQPRQAASELIRTMYELAETQPELVLHDYQETLKRLGLQWDSASLGAADVSALDGPATCALLTGIVRADRTWEGTVENFVENGTIARWLRRLEALA